MVSQTWAAQSDNHSTPLQALRGRGGEEPEPCFYSREVVPVSVCDIAPAPELKNMQTDFYACDRETSVSMCNLTFCFSPNAYFGGSGVIQKSKSWGELPCELLREQTPWLVQLVGLGLKPPCWEGMSHPSCHQLDQLGGRDPGSILPQRRKLETDAIFSSPPESSFQGSI